MMRTAGVLLLMGFVMTSGCDLRSRDAAIKNTDYAADLVRNGIDSSDELVLGMEVSEVLRIMGEPLWLRDVKSEQKTSWSQSDLPSLDVSRGKWRLWYSKQKDPTLDFIRVTVLVENGKVIEIEDHWYHE
jgi:hypothetical protein